MNLDPAGACIERILDQFLHRRGRTLDDLARSNAVDEDGIEATDGHVGPIRESRRPD
jgi:hypothetical protein